MIRELALFAGAGGGLLASELIGIDTRCAVEIDPYARKVLLARQRDGMLGRFPIWDDVKTFDGYPWRGTIDLVSGGFPCQDISAAGKGGGITAERSGLFFEMLRIIKEVRPRFVFAENSNNLRTRGLVTIVQEFNRLGYDVRWCVLGAWHVGAPHKRNRMWIFAYLPDTGGERLRVGRIRGGLEKGDKGKTAPKFADNGSARNLADADGKGELQQSGAIGAERRRTSDGRKKGGGLDDAASPHDKGNKRADGMDTKQPDTNGPGEPLPPLGYAPSVGQPRPGELGEPVGTTTNRKRETGKFIDAGFQGVWKIEPSLGRVANGVADRVDRLKALGNGQVPAVACLAWEILTSGILDDGP